MSLGSGAGQLIDQFSDSAPARVSAWDSRDDQSYPASVAAFLPKGEADCIRIVLADGRELLCTPDHRVLVRDSALRIDPNATSPHAAQRQSATASTEPETPRRSTASEAHSLPPASNAPGTPTRPTQQAAEAKAAEAPASGWRWVAAKDLDDSMRVACSADSPVPLPLSDAERAFELRSGDFTLRCSTPLELQRFLAYARLLGFINGDGCLFERERQGRNVHYEGYMVIGHQLGVCAIMDDIRDLTGITPAADVDGGLSGSEAFRISLPQPLSRSFALLGGQSLGNRVELAASGSWPTFLASAPRVIVQEFLGGLFGADGHSPYLRWEPHCSSVYIVQDKYIGMSCVNSPKEVAGLKAKMQQLIQLMQRVGMTTPLRLQEEKYTEVSRTTKEKRKMMSVNVVGKGVNGLEFARLIGFRYDVQKQMRLTAAAAWWRLADAIVDEMIAVTGLAEELRRAAGGTQIKLKYLTEAVLQYGLHSPILGGTLTTDFRPQAYKSRIKFVGQTGKRMKAPPDIHKHIPVKQFLVDLDLFSCFSNDPTLYDDKLEAAASNRASTSSTDDEDNNDEKDDDEESVDMDDDVSAAITTTETATTTSTSTAPITATTTTTSSTASTTVAFAAHESHTLARQLGIVCHCLTCESRRVPASAAAARPSAEKKAYGVERHWNGIPTFGMRVAKVDHRRRRLPVYDLTVPNYNSFTVNGVVVHNCGGQDTFMENYFESQKDAIFRNVEVLIYVFDIESPQHKRDMEQFLSCVEMVAKYSTSEQTKVYCLIHKMDLIHKEEDRMRIYAERDREIKAKVAPFFPSSNTTTAASTASASATQSGSTVTTFATSIWDETLYKAWSAIVHSLIPNVHTLERQLVAFCQLLQADEVVLFEKATFLVICSAVVKHNTDAHRYEKISNIIKQFKLSCSKSSNGEFISMQVQNKHFIAFIDQFTTNTYIMIVGPGEGSSSHTSTISTINGGGGGGKMLPAAVQLNLKVARPHFERFVQQNVTHSSFNTHAHTHSYLCSGA